VKIPEAAKGVAEVEENAAMPSVRSWSGRAALSSLALVASAAAAQLPPPLPLLGTRLDLVVEGTSTRVPDVAEIGAGVVTQAADASAAMAENARRMAAVIAALKAAGVAERDIRTSSLNLSPQYRYDNDKPPVLTGYQANNRVSVRFRDIARVGRIVDALVAQGANQIDGPNLIVDKPDAALDEARNSAVAKARARALLYANAAGLHLKRIVSISEAQAGYNPPPPMPMMMRAPAKADTPVAAGEQVLSVTLNVTFELE
jgi:uncharacterized protein YggE